MRPIRSEIQISAPLPLANAANPSFDEDEFSNESKKAGHLRNGSGLIALQPPHTKALLPSFVLDGEEIGAAEHRRGSRVDQGETRGDEIGSQIDLGRGQGSQLRFDPGPAVSTAIRLNGELGADMGAQTAERLRTLWAGLGQPDVAESGESGFGERQVTIVGHCLEPIRRRLGSTEGARIPGVSTGGEEEQEDQGDHDGHAAAIHHLPARAKVEAL